MSEDKHPNFCYKADEISNISNDVKAIQSTLNNGLKTDVALIKNDQAFIKKQIEEFSATNSALVTAINGLKIFQSEIKTKEKVLHTVKDGKKWNASTWLAIVAAISALGMFVTNLLK